MRKHLVKNLIPASILCTLLISGCSHKPSEGSCSVDAINGLTAGEVNKARKSGVMTVGGWAFDDRTRSVPGEVSIELLSSDGKTTLTGAAARGTKRPDVAKMFGNPAYIDAGFDGGVNVEKASPGRYGIWIVQRSGAKQLSCDSKKFVELE